MLHLREVCLPGKISVIMRKDFQVLHACISVKCSIYHLLNHTHFSAFCQQLHQLSFNCPK